MAGNIQNIMSVKALEAAARMADIDSLYRVIKQDPHVLDNIDSMPFVETPLHVVAASVDLPGHIQFATEIIILKPSFALKLNLEGLTPIHLALQNGWNRMALRLVDINKDLVRAKMRGGLTPLHLASQSGDIDLLKIFLKACPDSIEDVTVTGETAVHLAVQNNFETFKFLVKWLKRETDLQLERTILNRKNEDGNTILHIATLRKATEAIKLLINVTRSTMDLNAKNLMGQTALDIANGQTALDIVDRDIQRILVQATKISFVHSLLLAMKPMKDRIRLLIHFRRPPMTEENRNAYLVAATLVATATYQATLSPPGGFHQTDVIGTNHTLVATASNSTITEGKSVMSNKNFIAYFATNMCAFLASTTTIMSLLPRSFAWTLGYLSTLLLIFSYIFSIIVISPNDFTEIFFVLTFGFLYQIFFLVVIYG